MPGVEAAGYATKPHPRASAPIESRALPRLRPRRELKGADIDQSTLSSIGGGGPAGGDLTGTYPNPQIKTGAVGTSEVADESLTGSNERRNHLWLTVRVHHRHRHQCQVRPLIGMAVAGPGPQDFGIECNEVDLDIEYFDARVAAVALSPN